jgi:2-isopropylmalate synthase
MPKSRANSFIIFEHHSIFMSNRVIIFDTTLRDGEQCPGASMNLREKLEVARQLARLKVDVIEAGFPVISDGDFNAVKAIAEEIPCGPEDPVICGLARCVEKDIRAAGEAVKSRGREKGRIHVFLATSAIHREFKFKNKAKEEIVRMAVEGVKIAKEYTDNVEFSPEDASRTEPEFLVEVCQAVIAAGATTLNIPDTVGWAVPEEYGKLIKHLYDHVPEFQTGAAIISVHCHNDLGMAVANSLAAVASGARQIECTVNGIGERAGNAALEEVVMALKTRGEMYGGVETGIESREIVKTSKLVSRASSFVVQRNKAIVGENAFAHSSGIHQDGILKKRETYEIMDPQEVGWASTELPLTKHSGRNAVVARLTKLGHKIGDKIDQLFVRFKEIGDHKKFVYDEDLDALVDEIANGGETVATGDTSRWKLEEVQYSKLGPQTASAYVGVRDLQSQQLQKREAIGDGAVDAVFKAISSITNLSGELESYTVSALTEGEDALGQCSVKIRFPEAIVHAKAADPDVVIASGKACVAAMNKLLTRQTTPI